MKIVSISEIIDCNEKIKSRGLFFKIHLKDACGGQLCRIESLNSGNRPEDYQALYTFVEEFFTDLRCKVEYSEDRTTFRLL